MSDPTSASTSKFQELVEAYEVIGNEDARKRYDAGVGPVIRESRRTTGFKTPDDPKAAFYKSRLQQKMTNSPSTGRAYNFDEWTRQHYSQNLQSNISFKDQYHKAFFLKEQTEEKKHKKNLKKWSFKK
ncbi:hypothetical protein O181_088935 [Austropuccinia psidii MF-1]|uniref:J domain-containing protein n=1 Tax=Austropuccinia psidii MF-1 TaxID=1389203 RepID=A0A9Q3ISU2_9BASI|nr:hypothetical protein [Austropuccinia psidii MF-1]